ncbi:MAG: hypothetical protein ABSF14_01820 [Terriglobia bacterium]|jgi:hypothetical protein
MSLYMRSFHPLLRAVVLAACFALPIPAFSQTQESITSQLKEKLSKTGVFFRADVPRSLRNPDDANLPVYLEIINGIEKAAHTTGSSVSRYVQRDPLKLQGVNIYVKPTGAQHKFSEEPLLLGTGKDFSFDARTDGQPLVIPDRLKKTLEAPRDLVQSFLASHYLGGPFRSADLWVSFRVVDWPNQDFYLRVRLNATRLPQIPKWYRGDMHYHSGYTDNPAERGYPLDVTKQAALQAGMDWLLLADHSTDLSPERYQAELDDVKQFRDGRLMMIRGEEMTLSSSKDTLLTTVHMVVAPSPDDPDKGFPDPAQAGSAVVMTGDGSPASAAMPIRDALARVVAAGGFAYAAHPFDPISPLMRGGKWDLEADFLAPDGKQLQAGVVGLEPWNRATNDTADDMRDPFCIHPHTEASACFQYDKEANQYARLEQGIKLGWQPLLARGLQPRQDGKNAPLFKPFLAAGSDAHGDLDFEASMDVTDFLGKLERGLNGYAEDNALGRISTVVYAPDGMGARGENVLRALRDGRSVASNGPLLVAGFDRNSNGSLDDPEDVGIGQEISCPLKSLPPLQLLWVSSEEFGPFQFIRLIVGTGAGELEPVDVPVPTSKSLSSEGLVSFDLRMALKEGSEEWRYIRLEASTRNSAKEEFRCYTNPIWIKATGE